MIVRRPTARQQHLSALECSLKVSFTWKKLRGFHPHDENLWRLRGCSLAEVHQWCFPSALVHLRASTWHTWASPATLNRCGIFCPGEMALVWETAWHAIWWDAVINCYWFRCWFSGFGILGSQGEGPDIKGRKEARLQSTKRKPIVEKSSVLYFVWSHCGIYPDIRCGILSDIYSDILMCILSGNLADIYCDALSAMVFDIFLGLLSGTNSDILFDIYIYITFFCNQFSHFIRHSIWHFSGILSDIPIWCTYIYTHKHLYMIYIYIFLSIYKYILTSYLAYLAFSRTFDLTIYCTWHFLVAHGILFSIFSDILFSIPSELLSETATSLFGILCGIGFGPVGA